MRSTARRTGGARTPRGRTTRPGLRRYAEMTTAFTAPHDHRAFRRRSHSRVTAPGRSHGHRRHLLLSRWRRSSSARTSRCWNLRVILMAFVRYFGGMHDYLLRGAGGRQVLSRTPTLRPPACPEAFSRARCCRRSLSVRAPPAVWPPAIKAFNAPITPPQKEQREQRIAAPTCAARRSASRISSSPTDAAIPPIATETTTGRQHSSRSVPHRTRPMTRMRSPS